jgi:hypothetical protein
MLAIRRGHLLNLDDEANVGLSRTSTVVATNAPLSDQRDLEDSDPLRNDLLIGGLILVSLETLARSSHDLLLVRLSR